MERSIRIADGGGNIFDYRLEKRLHIRAAHIRVTAGNAFLCGSIDNGKVQLTFVRTKLHEKLERFVYNLVGSGSGTVDFIYDNNSFFV